MAERATYLYCLVESRRPPSLRGAPPGLLGAGRPRRLPAAPALWLVVADVPLARYGAEAINARLRDLDWVGQCGLAHEAVVEHVGRAGTVVPMKLFTLFTEDARAVAHVRRAGRRLAGVLRRVGRRQEWGVRMSVGPVRAAAPGQASRPAAPAGAGAGTRFLRRRQAEVAAARGVRAKGRREADRTFRALRARADAARRHAIASGTPDGRLLLDAAFLVPSRGASRFAAAVRVLGRRLAAAGYHLTLTGPWPPYNFVGPRT